MKKPYVKPEITGDWEVRDEPHPRVAARWTPRPPGDRPRVMRTKGYKSTEFYLTAFAALVHSFMASGLVGDDSQSMRIAGMVAATLATLGYQINRTLLKKNLASKGN